MGSCASLQAPQKADGELTGSPSRPHSPEGQQPFREAAKKKNSSARRYRHQEPPTFVITDDVLEQIRSRPTSPQCLSPRGSESSAGATAAGGAESIGAPFSANSSFALHGFSSESEGCSLPTSPIRSESPMPLPQTSEEAGGYRAQLAHKLPMGERVIFIE